MQIAATGFFRPWSLCFERLGKRCPTPLVVFAAVGITIAAFGFPWFVFEESEPSTPVRSDALPIVGKAALCVRGEVS
jgi:hypothetical protein